MSVLFIIGNNNYTLDLNRNVLTLNKITNISSIHNFIKSCHGNRKYLSLLEVQLRTNVNLLCIGIMMSLLNSIKGTKIESPKIKNDYSFRDIKTLVNTPETRDIVYNDGSFYFLDEQKTYNQFKDNDLFIPYSEGVKFDEKFINSVQEKKICDNCQNITTGDLKSIYYNDSPKVVDFCSLECFSNYKW